MIVDTGTGFELARAEKRVPEGIRSPIGSEALIGSLVSLSMSFRDHDVVSDGTS